jgi:group I intron endonuclease
MIGIYKIINPKGRVYIGQSIRIATRKEDYSKLRDCKGQPRLYASLVKYGFSEHIFEVVEECAIEDLNTRERHWQDFYEVLSEKGLNCRLTGTGDKSGCYSQEVRDKIATSLKAFNQTEEGLRKIATQTVNRKAFNQTEEGIADINRRALDLAAFNNTPAGMASRNKRRDTLTAFYQTEQGKKLRNSIAESNKKPTYQYSKDGTFIGEWDSGTEAWQTLGIQRGDISACCKGKIKSAGGFVWKYKEQVANSLKFPYIK